jgi:hypothetical protein
MIVIAALAVVLDFVWKRVRPDAPVRWATSAGR